MISKRFEQQVEMIRTLLKIAHSSDVLVGVGYRSREEGQQVEFSVEQGPKGLQAAEITLL